MPHGLNLVSIIFSFIVLFSAQDRTGLTITSKSELVVVPVTVTSNGAPVRGLHASDFVLKKDGKLQGVDTFEEVVVSPGGPFPRAASSMRVAQNYVTSGSQHQDVLILLLDYLNASWSSSLRIRSYLRDIALELEKQKVSFSVCLLTTKGLIQVHSIGNTGEEFLAAVDEWQRSSAVERKTEQVEPSWSQPFEPLERVDTVQQLDSYSFAPGFKHIEKDYVAAGRLDMAAMTLQAFEQLAEGFKGVPGRKKLLWLTIGYSGMGIEPRTGKPSNVVLDFRMAEKSSRALRALSEANMAVYPIDSNGVTNPEWEKKFQPALDRISQRGSAIAEKSSNTALMLEFAAVTGGKNCTAHPDVCVTRAAEDAQSYYVLGFYLRGEAHKGWHKLAVNVKQNNLEVRARSGFMVGDISEEKSVQDDMVLTALASAFDYTAIPLKLEWKLVDSEKGSAQQIELTLTSPPGGIAITEQDWKMDVECLVYVRRVGNEEGESFPVRLSKKLMAGEARDLAGNGFRFKKVLDLPPGTYNARVLLRDNVAKKIGTVSTVVANFHTADSK